MTPSVEERKPGQTILFDVTLDTLGDAAGVSGDNLWKIKPSLEDTMGNPVLNGDMLTSNNGVNLGTIDRSLSAGEPLTFENLEINPADLSTVVCPAVSLMGSQKGSTRIFVCRCVWRT